MAIKQQVLAELERHKGEYTFGRETGGTSWRVQSRRMEEYSESDGGWV